MADRLEWRIILVRHGETDWNRTGRFQGRKDIPLNRKGRQEAQELSIVLKKEPIGAIYTSPLIRAKKTAQCIKAFHPSASFFEDAGLIEMDLGRFDGMKASRWAEKYPDFLMKWRDCPSSVTMPGGESLQDVQTRAVKTVNRISRVHPPGTTIALCSHNFVITSLRCQAFGISLDEFRNVKQETGTHSILKLQGDHNPILTPMPE